MAVSSNIDGIGVCIGEIQLAACGVNIMSEWYCVAGVGGPSDNNQTASLSQY